jgi:phosphoribosylformylglycinamidine cyclo-ligase
VKPLLSGLRWRTDLPYPPVAPVQYVVATVAPAPPAVPVVQTAYQAAGVDIGTKMTAIESIQSLVRSTHTPHVIDIPNGFGGLCRVPGSNTIMVSSTDSVGSKTELIHQLALAAPRGKEHLIQGLGHDIVNHCVNDILVMGCVTPLTFLDYFASHTLDPEELRYVLTGMAEACRNVGCAIVGGETAEIKDTYKPGAVDIAGFITGVMTKDQLLSPRTTLLAGDAVIAIPSVSAHTNGLGERKHENITH